MKGIIIKLIDIVSVFLIIASTLLMLLSIFGAKDIFPYKFYRVLTGSMEPTIKTESLIITKEIKAEDLKEGDIISFYSLDPALQGNVNTHRIVKINRDNGNLSFTTKGDNNNKEDAFLVKEENIVGKVIFNSYIAGKVVEVLSYPLVFLSMIVIPLLSLLISNLKEAINNFKELKDE